MFLNFNNILLSIKFHVPHRCCVNCQRMLNVFNPTSLFLDQGCLLKRITKIIFWNLLRANRINICYIENFGVLLKKVKNWCCFLIWSSKIPKGICIYYERSIFLLSKKHNSFYLWLLELQFFWFRELILKGILSNPVVAFDSSKKG